MLKSASGAVIISDPLVRPSRGMQTLSALAEVLAKVLLGPVELVSLGSLLDVAEGAEVHACCGGSR